MANTNESTLTWLAGGGELGSLVRTYDWSQTPLGPAQQWPLSLRMAVSTCLGSSFPIVIWWGRDLILIYNDPYTSILGNKHPQALGQRGEDCWREVWPLVGPMLERVLDEGKPFTADDLQLMVWRHGYVLIPGSVRTSASINHTAHSLNCWSLRSAQPLPILSRTRPSANARRSWRSWIAQRRPFFPTSAMSFARR